MPRFDMFGATYLTVAREPQRGPFLALRTQPGISSYLLPRAAPATAPLATLHHGQTRVELRAPTTAVEVVGVAALAVGVVAGGAIGDALVEALFGK